MNLPRRGGRGGFTLIELLVVVAIIGILVGILLPAVQMAREAARGVQCRNNQKQIALALSNYADTEGSYPLGASVAQGWSSGSFFLSILPQLEQQNLFNRINFSVSYAEAQNATVHDLRPNMLVCPSDAGAYNQVI